MAKMTDRELVRLIDVGLPVAAIPTGDACVHAIPVDPQHRTFGVEIVRKLDLAVRVVEPLDDGDTVQPGRRDG